MSYKHPGRSPLWAILLLLCLPVTGVADDAHPLDPLDLSSPRATLNDFLTASDAFFSLLRDEYWQAPSRATAYRLSDALTPLERTLDLSEIPPASRRDLGRDGVVYLYEVLSRIELPPEADIPGAAAFADNKSASWTIPHTEITLLRSADGPRAGQFLFSSSTVLRAEEFYEKVRTLAYRRDVPLKNYAEMRPYLSTGGWLISSQTIEGFPGWLKHSFYQQAVWKYIALVLLIALTTLLVVVIHRLARRGFSSGATGDLLRRLATPIALLLTPLVLDMANRQLTLTGWVSGGVTWLADAIGYFALAWIAWSGSIAVAEVVIASPKIPDQSLNAHLLRLLARTFGIAAAIAIIFYVSKQLGVPLYGLVAGLGVGGIALALAAQPTIENFIGSINLFADQPVRVGDYCQFGDECAYVEEIGLRSTRLRKRDDSIVNVPNADFSKRELINFARRRRRLYETTLGLRYETSPEQLRYVMARLREMLHGHPKVSPDKLHVRFQGFGAYSLDLKVFAYIRTRDWLTFRAIREDINLRIIDIIEQAGTGFAFPSHTAYLGRDSGLDAERGSDAEAQVQEWRKKGQLPFPEFDQDKRGEREDVLDYPPEGSSGFKP